MKGMSQDRNALHGGKQVHGEAVGVLPLPERPKLALDPGQVLSEDLGRPGGDRPARLVELGAKRPDRAAALCQEILVLEDVLDAGAKPILGRSSFVPSLPLRRQLRQPQLDDRLANLVLGLEVIIDVAQGNLGFARDVGKRGGVPNPFWYAMPTAALTSRDRLSICVLAMLCISQSPNSIGRIDKPVKPPACLRRPLGARHRKTIPRRELARDQRHQGRQDQVPRLARSTPSGTTAI